MQGQRFNASEWVPLRNPERPFVRDRLRLCNAICFLSFFFSPARFTTQLVFPGFNVPLFLRVGPKASGPLQDTGEDETRLEKEGRWWW